MNTTRWTVWLLAAFHAPLSLYADGPPPAELWFQRFGSTAAQMEPAGVCVGNVGQLPEFSVTPAKSGRQLVRVSLPFAPASLPAGLQVRVHDGTALFGADLRALTLHPGQPASVRRAIVTFVYDFGSNSPHRFTLTLLNEPAAHTEIRTSDGTTRFVLGPYAYAIDASGIRVTSGLNGPHVYGAHPKVPEIGTEAPERVETVESGAHYVWLRVLQYDAHWPRLLEVRADSTGTAVFRVHVQRLEKGDGVAPNLGWTVSVNGAMPIERLPASVFTFADGKRYIPPAEISGPVMADFPDGHLLRRGFVGYGINDDTTLISYTRCSQDDRVPMQESAWRSATTAMVPAGLPLLSPMLEPAHRSSIASESFAPAYGNPRENDLTLWPALDSLRTYHRQAIARAALRGDDYGNVTSFTHGAPASYYGMNRLNHCPSIFDAYYRSGDLSLRETAVQWCANMYDLSLWWGDTPEFGGTRYNAAVAAGQKEHEGDTGFMWRTNGASNFCTKGYDAFFYAYEETGDPRFIVALNAQATYAGKHVHADRGECRNIGDVADFVRLYRFTGLPHYREEALRLFRELRTKLSEGDLFSQGGQPIVKDGPFIDDDQHGYEAPFAKPYIIGYALAGLPELLETAPEEPKLRDVVRTVADFLAETVDPCGGWRYPHPNSSGTIISQGMEHAAQLVNAARVLKARGEPIDKLLDAIETVLQARVKGFERTGTILAGLSGWESSSGVLKDGTSIYDLYQKPQDRDPSRDYTEGAVGIGSAPPDGLVYFEKVLDFYLQHRTAERLFHANEKLRQVLGRVPDGRLTLTPQPAGSFLRVAHPGNPNVTFTLWGPEWVTFPALGYSHEELGGMALEWRRDEASGAVGYTIERPDATFTAEFIPHTDYVECLYTTWPKPDASPQGKFAVGPCQQMKGGIFDGDDADLMARMYFVSEAAWTTIGTCANGNSRNIQYISGHDSPETTGEMAAGGWKTIQSPRPDLPLIACVSKDGGWIAATAAEDGTSICNNANASHRCMHAHGAVPLRRDGPVTLRVNAYLMHGTLDDLRARYDRDRARWSAADGVPGTLAVRTAVYGVRDMLPAFNDARVARMRFDLSWERSALPFDAWRASARAAYRASLGPRPPLAPFNVSYLATEDRGTYFAHKIALNLSADERVKAYLLIPKGGGPFPAMIALHDHGAHFSIGKEKVVRPFDEPEERLADAADWTAKYYGGQYIGDALAERGYVVFATDALFWGDRGRFGGVHYEDQQALGANMLQLGLSWAGTIVWDDLRSAEFVQGLPYVDPERIGSVGLSMGSHRSWSLSAATDIVACGAAICWMGDTATLTQPGNNQTSGQSAFSMLVPGLRNTLDYPDVASIASPKPMLFFNGTDDPLFPVPGVKSAFAKMQAVWNSQGAGERLVTKLWPVPHEFNAEMQAAAFAWLDTALSP